MKAQHTPGPWDLGSTDARSRYNGIFDKSGNLLADVYQPFWRRGDRPDDPQHLTQVANAQLMCAAPDLLSALQALLSEWRSRTALIESCDLTEAEQSAEQAAENAIAKAAGSGVQP